MYLPSHSLDGRQELVGVSPPAAALGNLSGLSASPSTPIEARPMMLSAATSSPSPAAPTFRYTPASGEQGGPAVSERFLLRMDCLVYCSESGRALDGGGLGASALTPALVRQLEGFRSCMIAHGGKPVGASLGRALTCEGHDENRHASPPHRPFPMPTLCYLTRPRLTGIGAALPPPGSCASRHRHLSPDKEGSGVQRACARDLQVNRVA